jgi:hypothetical protein
MRLSASIFVFASRFRRLILVSFPILFKSSTGLVNQMGTLFLRGFLGSSALAIRVSRYLQVSLPFFTIITNFFLRRIRLSLGFLCRFSFILGGLVSPFELILSLAFVRRFLMLSSPGVSFPRLPVTTNFFFNRFLFAFWVASRGTDHCFRDRAVGSVSVVGGLISPIGFKLLLAFTRPSAIALVVLGFLQVGFLPFTIVTDFLRRSSFVSFVCGGLQGPVEFILALGIPTFKRPVVIPLPVSVYFVFTMSFLLAIAVFHLVAANICLCSSRLSCWASDCPKRCCKLEFKYSSTYVIHTPTEHDRDRNVPIQFLDFCRCRRDFWLWNSNVP